jgi:lysine 2,3-aminomutase
MSIATVEDLVEAGLVPASRRAALGKVSARYAIGLTASLAALIDPGDPDDPIAKQFIPDPRELIAQPEESADPIGDMPRSPIEGIVHRYPDRVLLKLLHVCPVYCRFCFRREMVGPGSATHLSAEALDAAFAYIAAHTEIFEVILTGGDPLILSPRRLGNILARLAEIEHIAIVRIHTRVPVAAPELVTSALADLLHNAGKMVYVAIHANHPRELAQAPRAACARLADAGIPLLGQTVLLRGVNDNVEVLAELMRGFVKARVKPYYLHHPDLAPGTSHFRVSIDEGRALIRALRGRLSGLCQPQYVLDIPGGFGKVPIGDGLFEGAEGVYRATDFLGVTHLYPSGDARRGGHHKESRSLRQKAAAPHL